MSFTFYFKDGSGNIVDENGNDPMDIIEEENLFKLEELTSSLKGNRVNNDIKANAVHLVDIHPKNSARAIALQLKLEPRTVQRWYKSWKNDPDSLFKTIGRPRIIEPEGELAEAAKGLVTDFYFKQPTATVDQLMDQLTKNFEDFFLSKRTVYRYLADLWIFTLKGVEELKKTGVDYMRNCVFIDEAGFNANLRRSQGWSSKGKPATVKALTVRANSVSLF
ncbi:uncharacterized protein BX663DRAFT_562465 [Cokeromyces recurvatus]|uniref:uncharacterized protein n=1 Tax=Cokeromyces recurvatus TaxID=90255 RepID=UPI00221F3FC1|nr:uncharacterized protein BX663DRAFT_562465 [Cokeromyces recurvatus]KAI7901124.1 hypothetical protein BX663DRAFT_562465 [Cokeromyces recurvatus]